MGASWLRGTGPCSLHNLLTPGPISELGGILVLSDEGCAAIRSTRLESTRVLSAGRLFQNHTAKKQERAHGATGLLSSLATCDGNPNPSRGQVIGTRQYNPPAVNQHLDVSVHGSGGGYSPASGVGSAAFSRCSIYGNASRSSIASLLALNPRRRGGHILVERGPRPAGPLSWCCRH